MPLGVSIGVHALVAAYLASMQFAALKTVEAVDPPAILATIDNPFKPKPPSPDPAPQHKAVTAQETTEVATTTAQPDPLPIESKTQPVDPGPVANLAPSNPPVAPPHITQIVHPTWLK